MFANGIGLNNRFNVVLARVSGALAFTVKLLKKKKREECDSLLNYGDK